MRLADRKTPLEFETSDEIHEAGQYREVVVEAHPTHAVVRLKGLRGGYEVSWSAVWAMAAKAAAEKARREKKR